MKTHHARARRLVAQEFGDSPLIVWKDPRTCLTLPFWRRIFDEDPVIVIIHRHPIEIVGSLASRNQLGAGHVLAMWERYNADALRFSTGLPTAVIEYGRTIADPVGVVGSLVETLHSWGVDLPNDPATTDLELTTDSRHHEAPSAAKFDHPAATKSQRHLFNRLAELDGPHRKLKPGRILVPHPLSLEVLSLARERRLWAERPDLATGVAAPSTTDLAAALPDREGNDEIAPVEAPDDEAMMDEAIAVPEGAREDDQAALAVPASREN